MFRARILLVGVVAVVVAGCGRGDGELTASRFAADLKPDNAVEHLVELDRIAAMNGNNRALGTPGYQASLDYVVATLKGAGFTVDTPEFSTSRYKRGEQDLTVAGAKLKAAAMDYSPATPDTGVTAPVSVLSGDHALGCAPGDYAQARGTIVVVQRGTCRFTVKDTLATQAGAVGVLVWFAGEDDLHGTLDETPDARIPIMSIRESELDKLPAGTPATLTVTGKAEKIVSHSVIVQTTTGDASNVVVAGAHLDSVPAGPGINDDGTGTAALLAIALALGPHPKVSNAIRFAWWGGEEAGLLGSNAYVNGLSPQERLKIALYLNFDMLGSPNPGYLVYDGSNVTEENGKKTITDGPTGSKAISAMFNDYYADHGIATDPIQFDQRSDYAAFTAHGIPSGGVFTGAEGTKNTDQAHKWGGQPNRAYDPNYHEDGDTLANVDRTAFANNLRATAFGIVTYAQSVNGKFAVPVGPERDQVRGDKA